MTTERDPRTRIVLSWLREDAYENPERMLLRALDEVDATPQRRSWWPAWRSNRMNGYAKLIVAAAAVLVVAVVGYQFLPRSGGVGGEPSIAPSPSPTLLAQGSFHAKGVDVELDATADGDSVTGTMIVGDASEPMFAVDLQCARTAGDGRILIGGNTTESNAEWATKGEVTAIVLKPGSPVHAVFGFQNDAPSADTCMGYLDAIVDMHFATAIGDGALEPIEGTVKLGGSGSGTNVAPSPSPALLARGNFTSHGITAELDATGSGADVAGTMSLSESGKGSATVDLECARTTADGLIEIGGLITDSTYDANDQDWHGGFPEGQRVAIIFQPGSPVNAIWNVTAADQGVASCAAMFENLDGSADEVSPGSPGLDPIQGTVEFGP